MSGTRAHRYLALDSWRGICALLVALAHFHNSSFLKHAPIIKNAWLFVDFFFVLSGFVISCGYAAKIEQGFGIGRFMTLRFARLYPLHLATLMFVLAVGIAQGTAFNRGDQSASSLLANLLLVQSLGIVGNATWNQPSWSIGAEFYTYLIFAVATVALTRKQSAIAAIAAVVVLPIAVHAISVSGLDVDFRLRFLRCLYGFAMGVLCWRVHGATAGFLHAIGPRLGTAVELLAVAAAALFVSVSVFTVAAPYVFGVVVLVFAANRGALSALLRFRPFLAVGAWSYSIYMIHGCLLALLLPALESAGLARRQSGILVVGAGPFTGFAAAALFVAAVLACAALTFRYVEAPGRRHLTASFRGGSAKRLLGLGRRLLSAGLLPFRGRQRSVVVRVLGIEPGERLRLELLEGE